MSWIFCFSLEGVDAPSVRSPILSHSEIWQIKFNADKRALVLDQNNVNYESKEKFTNIWSKPKYPKTWIHHCNFSLIQFPKFWQQFFLHQSIIDISIIILHIDYVQGATIASPMLSWGYIATANWVKFCKILRTKLNL